MGALCRQLTLRHQTQSQGAPRRISASVGRGVSRRSGMAARVARTGHYGKPRHLVVGAHADALHFGATGALVPGPIQCYHAAIGDKGRPRRRRLRELKIRSRLNVSTGGSRNGIPKSGTLSWTARSLRIDEAEARIRANIASMRHSVLDSRRSIVEARKTIAWADRVLARQISDPHSDE
jgi:hypothetical protein